MNKNNNVKNPYEDNKIIETNEKRIDELKLNIIMLQIIMKKRK